MTASQLGAFVVTSSLLIVLPGVDMALMTRQVVVYGRRAALGTYGGLLTGGLGHASAATAGLSAVLAASSTAYALVRGIGASYLVWLGAQMLWNSRRAGVPLLPDVPARRGLMTLRRAYLLGLLSNLTNPKVLLFFVALLPQFVPPGPRAALRTAILSGLFIAMATAWWVGYVIALERLGGWLRRPSVQTLVERLSGVALVLLGVRLALEHL